MLGPSLLLGLALAQPGQHPGCAAAPTWDTVIVEYDRACFDFGPPRAFSGIWVDAFEGQTFFEGATSLADIRRVRSSIWLDVDRPWKGAQLAHPPRRADMYLAHAYLVRFTGAQAVTRNGRNPFGLPDGYGHLGMFPDLVVVDRFLSITDLGQIA